MGCRIFVGHDAEGTLEKACFYSPVAECVFGPIIDAIGDLTAYETAQQFVAYLDAAPNSYPLVELDLYYADFVNELRNEQQRKPVEVSDV